MKKIRYPSTLKATIPSKLGRKLDRLAVHEHASRPGILLKALDYYYHWVFPNGDRHAKKKEE